MVGKQTYTRNNRVKLVKNGPEYIKACIELIREAKEKILFHTYIFEEDEVTAPVAEELIKKAREGVKVFFLIDGFGSPELGAELKARFNKAGIHWDVFAPVFSRRMEHIGRRLHQKVLVCDNNKALTGGINLAAKFICPTGDNPWLDYAILIEGEEVYRLQRKILRLYRKHFPSQKSFLRESLAKESFNFEPKVPARALVNDFMRFKTEIHRSFIKALRESKESIKITATYFLPGKRLLRELKRAAKRGVKIELIFAERSDHRWERWPSRYLYSWYLENNLEIYEWGDSILHAKAALVDNKWVSIGSYNHNYVSRYGCLELNVEVLNDQFAQEMDLEFERIKARSKKINRDSWRENTSWQRKAFYFITYHLSNVLTFFSLLIAIRKKEDSES